MARTIPGGVGGAVVTDKPSMPEWLRLSRLHEVERERLLQGTWVYPVGELRADIDKRLAEMDTDDLRIVFEFVCNPRNFSA